jgi:elongation factor Ts
MAFTAKDVQALREKTGCGMMDCKKALVEADGNIENAIDLLRKKGLSKAAKKGDREASAGVVAVKVEGNKGVVVEVNSETDFVARNEKFQTFVKKVADVAYEANGDVAKIMESTIDGVNAKDELANQIATIGENLNIRRGDFVEVNNGAVISYVHNKVADGEGLIAVLVAIESTADKAKIQEVGDTIAMHIAASSPLFLNIADVDPAALEREKAIFRETALQSGKPAEIVEKMINGRINKYYEEVVLNEQAFFMEPSKKIKDVVASIGGDAKITKYVRFAVGEGVEHKEEA